MISYFEIVNLEIYNKTEKSVNRTVLVHCIDFEFKPKDILKIISDITTDEYIYLNNSYIGYINGSIKRYGNNKEFLYIEYKNDIFVLLINDVTKSLPDDRMYH